MIVSTVDVVLISQILNVHNQDILDCLGEYSFRRDISRDELHQLAYQWELPELETDINLFEDLDAEQAKVWQSLLTHKYQHVGSRRTRYPISDVVALQLESASESEASNESDANKEQLIYPPKALLKGVVWQHKVDQQMARVVPNANITEVQLEPARLLSIAHQLSIKQPDRLHLRRWDVLGFYTKKGKVVKPFNEFVGIVTRFGSEFGTIRSPFGEFFIHQNQVKTSIQTGDFVLFQAHFAERSGRFNAKECELFTSLEQLKSDHHRLAILNHYLFENPVAVPAFFRTESIPVGIVDALLRYQLANSFSIADDPRFHRHIPGWAFLQTELSTKIVDASDLQKYAHPISQLISTLQTNLPDAFTDASLVESFIQKSFWLPLQHSLKRLPKGQWLDFAPTLLPALQKINPATSCPDWHLESLPTVLQEYCAKTLVSSETEEEEINLRYNQTIEYIPAGCKIPALTFQYTPEYHLQKWIAQLDSIEFPRPDTIQELADLLETVPEQRLSDALLCLSDADLTKVCVQITKSAVSQAISNHLFDKWWSTLRPVVVDLEVTLNGQVREACCRSVSTGYLMVSNKAGEWEAFLASFQHLLGEADLLVGHNIKTFDLPILEQAGIQVGNLPIWDTLHMEAFLAPLSDSFALVTKHEAEADTEKTLRLFRNQVQRLLLNWADMEETCWAVLPKKVFNWLHEFYHQFGQSLNFSVEERSHFFHDTSRKLPEELTKLSESNTVDERPLVVAPRLVWSRFVRVPGIRFCGIMDETDAFGQQINADKGRKIIKDDWVRHWLLRFLAACEECDVVPVVANLPVWTKIQVENVLTDLSIICHSTPLHSESANLAITDEVGEQTLLQTGQQYPIERYEPHLSSITTRYSLGILSFDSRQALLREPAIWQRLAGGGRFVSVPYKWLIDNHVIPSVPDWLDNFWIERTAGDQYTVWGNQSRPETFQAFTDEKVPYAIAEPKTGCELSVYVTADPKGLYMRLNPDTPYRAAYWTGQMALVNRISTKSPVVFLIQRATEVATLQEFLESNGFQCPPVSRPLMRRLEMLNKATNKGLMVATLDKLPDIAQLQEWGTQHHNWGPLTVIIDNLPLDEINFMQPGPANDSPPAPEPESPDEKESEDETEEALLQPKRHRRTLGSVETSLRLITPLLRYYYQLLSQSDAKNILILIDPRLSDHPDIAQQWKANITRAEEPLWKDDKDYEERLKKVGKLIESPRRAPDTIDYAAAKETIEKVFFGIDKQEEPNHRLFDYQQPFFDKIIKRTGNLLVSLPTGGGKSILFQGPALYRGSLTNRLTLVITPLRALMEDQVVNLEKLGFFNCVEYINQQSPEIPDIYRRLAGGDILLLYVTPERFRSRKFRQALDMRLLLDQGLEYVVFDEAHCISQWGNEFRPDYLWVAHKLSEMQKTNGNFPALFFSATVSEQIYADLNQIFR